MSSDNPTCMKLIEDIIEISNVFGYGEVNPYNRHSTLMRAYKHIENPKFKHYILKDKQDVYHAMKSFFKKKLITS